MSPHGGLGSAADLRQEQTADYRSFDLRGSHFEIGFQMGRATPMRQVRSWRDADEEIAFAEACLEQVGQRHPGLTREVAGFAAGQGRSREEVLSHYSLNLPEGSLSGCTTLALRLGDGHMLIARNYDFLRSQRERYLRRVAPTGYPASLGSQAGLIASCYDGVSSRGLFVALHLIHAQIAHEVPPGLPYHLIPRILLETCSSAGGAAAMLADYPHLFPFNYLVADSRQAFALEAYPGRVRMRELTDGCLVVTNYYAHPDMRPLQGRRRLEAQRERVAWIERQAGRAAPRDAKSAWTWAQGLLRNHDVPVCHHRPNQATLWAMTADLNGRRVAYCLGAPCRNQFVDHAWPTSDGSESA